MNQTNWSRNSIGGILQNEFLGITLLSSKRINESNGLRNEFFPVNNRYNNRLDTTSKFIIDNDSIVYKSSMGHHGYVSDNLFNIYHTNFYLFLFR